MSRLLRSLASLSLLAAATTFAAEPIQPAAGLPETSPWDLKSLSEPPAVEWIDKTSTIRSLLYGGEAYRGQPTRVFAWYATPGSLAGDASKDRKLPAVVLVHGGGGTAFREWAELWATRGYAAIAMDLAGNRPGEGTTRTRLPDGGPDQGDDTKFGAIGDAVNDHWSYHAVANVLRAHSLIRSFQEVDAERTAITGISWGGYLTCIAASLDTRFKAAVPVYGCGFLHENSAWLGRFASLTPENRARWIALYDPSQYLKACRVPIFFVNGTNDFAYPLDSYRKSFDVVPGPRNIRVTVNMPHGHPQGWAPAEIGAFIDEKLLGAAPLPVVSEPAIADGKLTAQFVAKSVVKSASLHHTNMRGAINKRSWTSTAAEVLDGKIVTTAPPKEATAWFVTVADNRGLTTSSPVVLAKEVAEVTYDPPVYIYVSMAPEQKIQVFSLHTVDGRLLSEDSIAVEGSPGSLAIVRGTQMLYASLRSTNRLAAYKLYPPSASHKLINSVALPEGENAAYVRVDPSGRWLLSASYSAGKVVVHRLKENGEIESPAVQTVTTAKTAHCVAFDPEGKFAFVPHVAPNAVYQFRFDSEKGQLADAGKAAGGAEKAGPRHLAFHPTLPMAFTSDESGSSITSYRFDPATGLKPEQTLSTLPADFKGNNSTAEVKVHPNGRFVWVSNRGHDSLAGFAIDAKGKLTPIGQTPTEKTPRSFEIEPGGRFAFGAGEGSGKLVVYRIDAESGKLTPLHTLDVGKSLTWVTALALPVPAN